MLRTVWGRHSCLQPAIQPAPRRVEAERLISTLIVLALLAPPILLAQSSADAVKQLATRILSQVHSTVSLAFENRSSLAAAAADAVRASLEEQLRAGGLSLGESETKLRVTIGEDQARYLLTVQNGAQANIVSWKKPPATAPEYRVSIKRSAIWEQRDPILDVALFNDGAGMLVLEGGRVVQYSKTDGQWRIEKPSSLTFTQPMPRDPRGRITGTPPAIQVSAPGLSGPNALRWVAGRNYRDGDDRGMFFTEAQIADGELLAGIDGHTRLYTPRGEAALTIDNWGDDIAAIASECGGKRQVLAAAPGTDGAPDQLQACEFAGAAYAAVSERLPVAGPVTALWPAESPDRVTMVVHNRQTGMYEASRISLSCDR
jgi:hypothetical protein